MKKDLEKFIIVSTTMGFANIDIKDFFHFYYSNPNDILDNQYLVIEHKLSSKNDKKSISINLNNFNTLRENFKSQFQREEFFKKWKTTFKNFCENREKFLDLDDFLRKEDFNSIRIGEPKVRKNISPIQETTKTTKKENQKRELDLMEAYTRGA